MSHEIIRQVAKKYGVRLGERSCYHSYVWNGEDLALFYTKELWDDEYEFAGLDPTLYPIGEDQLLHEIAHHVVADKLEREFPEFGMDLMNWGPYYITGGREPPFNENWEADPHWRGVLTREEQDFREAFADLLGCYWCDQYGIPVHEKAYPTYKYVQPYQGDIIPEVSMHEHGWRAIIRLREMGLIP